MKNFVLALSLIGFGVAPALAQEMDFTTLDADGDGQVTMTEAVAGGWNWSDEEFNAADSNGDGTLNAEEFAAVAG